MDCFIFIWIKLEVYVLLKWLGDGWMLDDYVGIESIFLRIRLKLVFLKKGFYRVCLFFWRIELLYLVLYFLVYNKKEVFKDMFCFGYFNMEVFV